jgi:hypothetical protein
MQEGERTTAFVDIVCPYPVRKTKGEQVLVLVLVRADQEPDPGVLPDLGIKGGERVRHLTHYHEW